MQLINILHYFLLLCFRMVHMFSFYEVGKLFTSKLFTYHLERVGEYWDDGGREIMYY